MFTVELAADGILGFRLQEIPHRYSFRIELFVVRQSHEHLGSNLRLRPYHVPVKNFIKLTIIEILVDRQTHDHCND